MSAPQSVGIILSSAYIAPGLVSELGLLPPSFLPLANRRLYSWQVESLRPYVQKIRLTVPQKFEFESFDRDWLKEHDVEVFPMEEGKSLGQAVAHCLANLDVAADDVWLLFGDTLLADFEAMAPGTVATGFVQEHSRWGYCWPSGNGNIEFSERYETGGRDDKPVIVGAFRLSRRGMLECLTSAAGDFFTALGLYGKKHGISLIDKSSSWHDFGHLNTYFRSRQQFTTERKFNNIRPEKRRMCKYSGETLKILSEINWYETVPPDIRVFLPEYLGRVKHNGTIGYAMEYLYLLPLNDLFVYGRLPEYVWEQILGGCNEFLKTCRANREREDVAADYWWMYADKTRERLERFSQDRGISLHKPWRFNGRVLPSLEEIFRRTLARVAPPSSDSVSVSHGDFHFANIFFDFRALGIKTLDPRGIVRNLPTINGDYRYDLAKLAHSVDGLYDFIIADIFKAHLTDTYDADFSPAIGARIKSTQKLFGSMRFNGLSPRSPEIRAMVVLLFMSMLPLHAENKQRQDTLLANVFRLFVDIEQD